MSDDKIAICLIGNSDSGKSSTWYSLFGKRVHRGSRQRSLRVNMKTNELTDVFIINGSPQENWAELIDWIPQPLPRIVLCSIQYYCKRVCLKP